MGRLKRQENPEPPPRKAKTTTTEGKGGRNGMNGEKKKLSYLDGVPRSHLKIAPKGKKKWGEANAQ